MTSDEAATIAEEFLKDFTLGDDYAVKPVDGREVERLLYLQHVAPRPDSIHVVLGLESDDLDEPQDPEIQDLATGAIRALREAHPELASMPITFEVI
jgi:hypothetical protein